MPKSNTSSRMLTHPAIEDGNRSFPQGSYQVRHKPSVESSTEVILYHKLEGAPFIQSLIDRGDAKFACLVSVPKTGYRELRTSDNSEQKISWDLNVAGERAPFLGPCILYVGEDLKNGTWTEEDGVAEDWLNLEIDIPKGSRLAKYSYLRPSSEIQDLLTAEIDEDANPGTFTVLEVDSNDGFYFQLRAAKDIFAFIKNPQGNRVLERSIITHAVSECFHILKTDYGTSGEGINKWEEYPNLVALSERLENEGLDRDWENRGIAHHWSNNDFDPIKVATELYPIDPADSIILEEDDE